MACIALLLGSEPRKAPMSSRPALVPEQASLPALAPQAMRSTADGTLRRRIAEREGR
jgi:hypothetical protein